MKFDTFYPEQALLQKHIEYYYFFKNNSSDFRKAYCSFPNTTTPVNIHKNVDVSISGSSIKVSESKAPNYIVTVNQVRQSPLFVEWGGKLDKVTIVFKPLGLNNFINEPLADVVQGISQVFLAWQNAPNFNFFLDSFYSCSENAMRVTILEDFLCSVYNPLRVQAALDKAIFLLSDFDHEMQICKVAEISGLSYRTFDRLFKQHLGISPAGYKKIARFRHSLRKKVFRNRFEKLTNVCYESNFYDQAYFIKVYNKLTGVKPTAFFKSIETLADQNLILKYSNNQVG